MTQGEGAIPEVEWTVGSGTLVQEIWRSTEGGEYVLYDFAFFDATSYLDVVTTPGVIYCYKVRGKNACGYSEFSNSDCLSAVATTTTTSTTTTTTAP